ncbi:hypothetical protein FGU65_07830 [Methanoculleus sp. FWC-SCC1]|uniref:Sporulation protein YtfJ n=2 Tax=Methanoculleus frigidifontis TaxID=2584085 RepID=A0ABT8MA61_9EURY|nr:hypothetical protein [Methanoculleus sp. FWC-SCC1]
MLQLTVDQLGKMLCASTVIGAPIEAGDRVILPVAEFGFGFGAGEGSGGKTEAEKSGGAGTGGGGSVSVVALVIIHRSVTGPEGVQVISLKKKSELSEVITTLGETVGPHIGKAMEKGSEMMMKRQKEAEPAGESKEIRVKGEGEL